MKFLSVTTSTATLLEAQQIAQAAIEKHLAACAHVSPVESFFFWNGALQRESEYQLSFKTTDARYDELAQLIKHMHSYELPAIDATVFEKLDPAYASWVRESVSDGAAH